MTKKKPVDQTVLDQRALAERLLAFDRTLGDIRADIVGIKNEFKHTYDMIGKNSAAAYDRHTATNKSVDELKSHVEALSKLFAPAPHEQVKPPLKGYSVTDDNAASDFVSIVRKDGDIVAIFMGDNAEDEADSYVNYKQLDD